MTTRKRLALAPFAAAIAALVAAACTPKDETTKATPAATSDKDEGKDEGKDPPPGGEATKDGAPKDSGGLADVVKDAIPAPTTASADLPDRGIALGWFIARNPEATLAKVGAQVLPAKYKMYADPTTLRSMGAMLGGAQANVFKNADIAQAAGCVLIDDTAVDVPVACFFGYTGGAATASTDVAEGKQPDAKGHVAHHIIEGQDVYLDDLGSVVVATTHAGLFDKAKDYLDKTLIPHAKVQRDDLAMVMFPAPAMKRYAKEIEPMLRMLATTPGGGDAAAMYEEIETFVYAFSLEPDGAHVRMAVTPTPGSNYASMVATLAAGELEPGYVGSLPASTWMLAAWRMHGGAMLETGMMKSVIESTVSTYAAAAGKDAATVTPAVLAFLDEAKAQYGPSFTFAMTHEPGTTGAAILQAEKTAPGRESWKTWSEAFSPEAVLDAKGAGSVSWTFKADAVTTDGVAADRWVITPKPGADRDIDELAPRFGGKVELTIDRYELPDRVVFVAALSDVDKHAAAALAAIKGTGTLADVPGAAPTLDAGYKSASLLAADLARMFTWLGAIAPEKAPFPAVGNDLSDAVALATMKGTTYDIDMALSQPTIEQIKALIP